MSYMIFEIPFTPDFGSLWYTLSVSQVCETDPIRCLIHVTGRIHPVNSGMCAAKQDCLNRLDPNCSMTVKTCFDGPTLQKKNLKKIGE